MRIAITELVQATNSSTLLKRRLRHLGTTDYSEEMFSLRSAWTDANRPITLETLDCFEAKLLEGLKSVKPIDAVFVGLHGAAGTEGVPDVAGICWLLSENVSVAKLLVLKSGSNCKAFEPYLPEVIRANIPVSTISNLQNSDWVHLPRRCIHLTIP